MTEQLKELIENNIKYIDSQDFARLFFESIQEDTMRVTSNLTIPLYELLHTIGITDTDIYNSQSNSPELMSHLTQKFKEKGYSQLQPLVAYLYIDMGKGTDYYDLIALLRNNDHVIYKYASVVRGENSSLKTGDDIIEYFVDTIIKSI